MAERFTAGGTGVKEVQEGYEPMGVLRVVEKKAKAETQANRGRIYRSPGHGKYERNQNRTAAALPRLAIQRI